ncbi:lactose ABC transporter permease [Luteimicrobium album]|uniref:Lactose ABC transporter permease n=1 Tax=Luteimicrobium album TaxID=1054550 RepID=A0ABQ6HXE0_9MICO|nr:carbohydrate ABC transporter permease [Luteimicrobium album]GMA23185.1 lactose ABC transporter permease [Luteimicrobium album]
MHASRTFRITMTAVAVIVSLLFLAPVLWLVASTFRTATETFANSSPVGWSTLWPQHWTTVNLSSAIDNGFLRSLGNSIVVAGVTVVVGLAISAMAAYALAVIPFRGRSAVFTIVVLSFLVSFEAIAIPLSQSFSDWGLSNSLVALILPGLGNGLVVFTLRQFFLGVPPSLAEAAKLDGAGPFRTFWSVYLPLTKPALIGAGLILFLFQWQAYLWPLLIISHSSLDLAPVTISKAFGGFSTDYGRVFAETAILAVIPAGVLLALQRYFVTSVASTGSKE